MEAKILVQYQDRKTLALKATPQGLLALIPHGLEANSPPVQQFIARGLRKLESPPPTWGEGQPQVVTPTALRARVDDWATRLGVQVKRVQIRSMRTKWASCSSSGALTLNADLLTLPPELVDYVLCHDLLHLRIPNHGKGFHAMLGCYLPDWKNREVMLASWIK